MGAGGTRPEKGPAFQGNYQLHIAAVALRQADKQAVGTPASGRRCRDNLAGGLVTPRSVAMVTWFFLLKMYSAKRRKMADKILPQRVSAFHSSPQAAPPLCSSILPSSLRSKALGSATFTFCFKSSLGSEAPFPRGWGWTEGGRWRGTEGGGAEYRA